MIKFISILVLGTILTSCASVITKNSQIRTPASPGGFSKGDGNIGNGGGACVCDNQSYGEHRITDARLLDVVQIMTELELSENSFGDSLKGKAYANLVWLSPKLAAVIFDRVRTIEKNIEFKEYGVSLPLIVDYEKYACEFSNKFICEYGGVKSVGQVAIYTKYDKLLISKTIFDNMRGFDKEILLLHEAIYYLDRKYNNATNSEFTKETIKTLLSSEFNNTVTTNAFEYYVNKLYKDDDLSLNAKLLKSMFEYNFDEARNLLKQGAKLDISSSILESSVQKYLIKFLPDQISLIKILIENNISPDFLIKTNILYDYDHYSKIKKIMSIKPEYKNKFSETIQKLIIENRIDLQFNDTIKAKMFKNVLIGEHSTIDLGILSKIMTNENILIFLLYSESYDLLEQFLKEDGRTNLRSFMDSSSVDFFWRKIFILIDESNDPQTIARLTKIYFLTNGGLSGEKLFIYFRNSQKIFATDQDKFYEYIVNKYKNVPEYFENVAFYIASNTSDLYDLINKFEKFKIRNLVNCNYKSPHDIGSCPLNAFSDNVPIDPCKLLSFYNEKNLGIYESNDLFKYIKLCKNYKTK